MCWFFMAKKEGFEMAVDIWVSFSLYYHKKLDYVEKGIA